MATVRIDGRSERSRRTRQRIVDAATALFVEQGYVATTLEDVARRADVSVQTIYYSFGTKRRVLEAVLGATVAGDHEHVGPLDRPWVASLAGQPEPRAALGALVEGALAIVARTVPVYEVIRRAASDPDVADLLDTNRRERGEVQRELVALLHRAGHLRDGLELEDAVTVVYGLVNEEVFQLFVSDCGWTPERFGVWVHDTLASQLL
jgi:AcrR family transcriptional regulator